MCFPSKEKNNKSGQYHSSWKIKRGDMTLFHKAVNFIHKRYQNRTINTNTLIVMVGEVMKYVEGYSKPKTGPTKKSIVVDVIRYFINHRKWSKTETIFLNIFMETILPNLIDELVSASKGGLSLNVSTKKKKREKKNETTVKDDEKSLPKVVV